MAKLYCIHYTGNKNRGPKNTSRKHAYLFYLHRFFGTSQSFRLLKIACAQYEALKHRAGYIDLIHIVLADGI